MKKLFLLSTVLVLFSNFVLAQKIQNVKTNEIVDLKEKVDNYCTVVQQPFRGKIDFFVGLNELGVWKLLDEKNNPVEFQTIIAIMNFLYIHGWEYVNNIGGSDGAAPQYFFRKKE